MKYLLNTSTDPYFNLSFDEYCLEHLSSEDSVFYLWRNCPAVIVGLNQNVYSEVNLDYLRQNGIALARRVTGGGAVYHDLQNLNYTIIGRKPSPEPILQALRSLGVDAELSGRNDIFVDGRKVSGYARRVWQDREMIHGTLMYDVDIDALVHSLDVDGSKLSAKGVASVRSRVCNLKDYLPRISGIEELKARLQEILADGDGELTLSQEALDEVRKNAENKFASWDWIYGRSRGGGFHASRRLPCGTVDVNLSLDHARISDIGFSGDFIGNSPASALEADLLGTKYGRDEVLSVINAHSIENIFPGASPEEITDLITSSASPRCGQ